MIGSKHKEIATITARRLAAAGIGVRIVFVG